MSSINAQNMILKDSMIHSTCNGFLNNVVVFLGKIAGKITYKI
jgi:hypothetical protein